MRPRSHSRSKHRPRGHARVLVLMTLVCAWLLACRQPSAAIEIPAEPTGLSGPSVFVEAPTAPSAGVVLDWTRVDDRFAGLVQAAGQSPRFRVDYDADHPFVGASTPLVTIIVFSDYQCPYCKRFDDTLVPLLARYPNQLRVVWRQFPLPMHGQADFAAAAALAAHAQGQFAPMHAWLYEHSRALTPVAIEQHAAGLGLDPQRLLADIDDGWLDGRIAADIAIGKRFGVRGTPHYFINGRSSSGARGLEELDAMVAEELTLAEQMIAAGADPREIWARILAASNAEYTPPSPAPTPALAPSPSPPPASNKRYATALGGLSKRGARKAKIELLMCGDFDCPYSKRATATLDQLLKDHKGDLAVYFRHHPLPMHKQARAAHRAAVAAENQGKFWEMFELLYAEPKKRSDAELEDMAKQLNLDMSRFRKDVAAHKTEQHIDEQVRFCEQDLDAKGTPSFFINGRPLTGAQPIEKFEAIIQEELAGKGPP